MRHIDDRDMIRIYEFGQGKTPVERSLICLGPAFPELSYQQLSDMPIGERELRLLAVREFVAGPNIRGAAKCPQCRTELEFSLKIDDIRMGDYQETKPKTYVETLEGFQLQFRLPTTSDQLSIIREARTLPHLDDNALSFMRQLLLRRTILTARDDAGDRIDPVELPVLVLEALGDRINELDPQAEIHFKLNCAACQHQWSAHFEAGRFVWSEINAQAKRTLTDVVALAQTYGWSESEILAMTPHRRQAYLDLAP